MKYSRVLCSVLLILLVCAANAQFTDLHDYNDTDGAYPTGPLVVAGKMIYGSTNSGNLTDGGTIFSMDSNGHNYKILYNFNGALSSSSGPENIILSGGKLYGMTREDGVDDLGTIFSIDTNGNNFKKLYDFDGTNGSTPEGGFVISGNVLYGMTSAGGASGNGVVFSIDTNGSNFDILLNFNGANGAVPTGSLALLGKTLFGMTSAGGSGGNYGCVFSMDTNGNNYNKLLSFNITNGRHPLGSLTIANNKLYGMTEMGGTSVLWGLIFSIDTNGSNYKDMFDFNVVNGGGVNGSLTYNNGILYGLSFDGGLYNEGDLFSIDTNGSNFTDLHDFDDTDGFSIEGTLTFSHNILYGPAWQGGPDNYFGLIFCFNTFFNFAVPFTNVSCNGGDNGVATVNSIGGVGTYTYLWEPGGQTTTTITGLSAGIYSLTVTDSSGNITNSTVVITQPGVLGVSGVATNVSCNGGANGVASCNIIGGTSPYTYSWSGGLGTDAIVSGLSAGTYSVFVADSCGGTATASVTITQPTALAITTNVTNTPPGSCMGAIGINVVSGTSPYSYSWTPSVSTNDYAFNLCSGSYCCLVTDANGCMDSVCVVLSSEGINSISYNDNLTNVYPNPSNGQFTFSYPAAIAGSYPIIEVYNILGEKVYSNLIVNSSSFIVNLNQPNGIYLYRVISENGNLLGEGKLVIQK